jgi:hypothetical protein
LSASRGGRLQDRFPVEAQVSLFVRGQRESVASALLDEDPTSPTQTENLFRDQESDVVFAVNLGLADVHVDRWSLPVSFKSVVLDSKSRLVSEQYDA